MEMILQSKGDLEILKQLLLKELQNYLPELVHIWRICILTNLMVS